MKNIASKLSISVTALAISISCMITNIPTTVNAVHASYQAETLTEKEDYVEVNAGNVFDEIISSINFGYTEDYKILVPTNFSHMGSYMALTPLFTIGFEVNENISDEQAENGLRPILEKYSYPLDFSLSEENLYTCELNYNDVKSGNIDLDLIKDQSEQLMSDLKEIGIVTRFYPLGSMYEKHALIGNASEFSVKDKVILEEYVKNNLVGYTLGENSGNLVLSGDSSKSLQDEFDAIAKIYEDTGIKSSFGELSVAFQPVGYGIDLSVECTSEDIQPLEPTEEATVTPTENTPATLKGDADLNGEVGIADVVIVSKHNINSETYPLVNETAEANADMNNDNVVDGLDTQALVEYNLGKR